MPQPIHKSVLQAIEDGHWDFEPQAAPAGSYDSTAALPGSTEKLSVLAERVRRGLPLWHEEDRRGYDEAAEA